MKKYEELAQNEVLSDLAKALLLKFYTLNTVASSTRQTKEVKIPFDITLYLFDDGVLWIEDVIAGVRDRVKAGDVLNELSKRSDVTL